MVPGWAGNWVTVTLLLCVGPDPHELLAFTVIVPPLAPAVLLMDVEVELPLHPEGSVHVYEVAPDTAEIL